MHFLGGNGVGRYGTAGLSDVTVHPDGTPALIRSYQGLATLEFHTKKWDVYFNGGEEYAGRISNLNAAGKLVGYGVQSLAATGCFAEVVPGAGGFRARFGSSVHGEHSCRVRGYGWILVQGVQRRSWSNPVRTPVLVREAHDMARCGWFAYHRREHVLHVVPLLLAVRESYFLDTGITSSGVMPVFLYASREDWEHPCHLWALCSPIEMRMSVKHFFNGE